MSLSSHLPSSAFLLEEEPLSVAVVPLEVSSCSRLLDSLVSLAELARLWLWGREPGNRERLGPGALSATLVALVVAELQVVVTVDVVVMLRVVEMVVVAVTDEDTLLLLLARRELLGELEDAGLEPLLSFVVAIAMLPLQLLKRAPVDPGMKELMEPKVVTLLRVFVVVPPPLLLLV